MSQENKADRPAGQERIRGRCVVLLMDHTGKATPTGNVSLDAAVLRQPFCEALEGQAFQTEPLLVASPPHNHKEQEMTPLLFCRFRKSIGNMGPTARRYAGHLRANCSTILPSSFSHGTGPGGQGSKSLGPPQNDSCQPAFYC